MAKTYTVTGACVTHIPVAGPDGQMLVTLYQGAPLPEGVPAARIKHLLDSNLIAEQGSDEAAEAADPANPNGDPAGKGGEAEGKLDGRSSKATLVDHAVSQGMAREDAEAMTRDQLLDTYVRKPAE